MRTTVTLDPDVEALVAKAMRERGASFKAVVNAALRAGLGSAAGSRPDFFFPAYSLGEPRVDLTHAIRLAGELEDDELVRRLEAGR